MIKVMYTKDFDTQARTLPVKVLGKNKSGWVVQGPICEDYYQWINRFEAEHPIYGKIVEDFEDVVIASSEACLNHFLENHPYEEWDYWDI